MTFPRCNDTPNRTGPRIDGVEAEAELGVADVGRVYGMAFREPSEVIPSHVLEHCSSLCGNRELCRERGLH